MFDWLEALFASRRSAAGVAGPAWVDPRSADPFGLVGVGGDLDPQRLLAAYRQGVFPMYEEGEPVCWWSPDPRAVFEIGRLRVSRRLARTARSGAFTLTTDRAFADVMHGCADRGAEGTWITRDMLDAYCRLHEMGHAHSVEAWQGRELVGGVYGVTIGGLFAGESMFYRRRDASKVALVFLMERLRERGFELFDTQFLNEHTESLGAVEIPRDDYLDRLARAITRPVRFD